MARMVDAFRFVSRLIGSAPMSEYVDHHFIDKMAMGQPPDALTLKLLQDNARARLLSSTASFAMDQIPGVRKKVLATSGPSVEDLLRGPDALPRCCRESVIPAAIPWALAGWAIPQIRTRSLTRAAASSALGVYGSWMPRSSRPR